MIYITKQYLTDKKEKTRKASKYFLIFLPHLEKLVAMATPMHILQKHFLLKWSQIKVRKSHKISRSNYKHTKSYQKKSERGLVGIGLKPNQHLFIYFEYFNRINTSNINICCKCVSCIKIK